MKHDAIKTAVLSIKMIPNADPMLREALRLEPDERSLGLITTDCDDVSYAALDEATKKAEVRVAYARVCMPAREMPAPGLPENLSVFLPEKIRQRFGADWRRRNFISKEMRIFYSADDEDSVVYFAQCISRTGSYLSEAAGVLRGHRWLI